MSANSNPPIIVSAAPWAFRTIDRSAGQDGTVRTSVAVIDLGGGDGATESLLTRGAQTRANSISVGLASDQTGTAGSPASQVITVQGITSGQPVIVSQGTAANLLCTASQGGSWSVTANAGTNLNTSALALESGGNLASVATNTTGLNNAVGTAASPIPSKGLIVQGSDGTNARAISVTTAGIQKVDLSGTAANGTAIKVDGSAVTQPVSVASAITVSQGTAASLNATVVGTGTFAVQASQSGTWNVTNISGTVSLPTGAATAAKQPALGTAGTASSDVITVQGIASMTALTVAQPTAASLNATVVGTGTFAVQAATAGDVASGSSDSGNPVKQGFRATTSLAGIATVTDGQRVNGAADISGAQIVRAEAGLEDIVAGTASATGTSNTSVVSALGAGVRYYLTDLCISNSSATSVEVSIVDDVGGANTVLWGPFPVPGNTSGVVKTFGRPLRFSANKAAGFVSLTGVTTIKVSFNGFKAKI